MNPVFDFHARLVPEAGAVDRLLAVLDAHGIAGAAMSAGGVVDLDRLSTQLTHGGHVATDPDNDAVLAACAEAAGRLVPFYFANPHRGAGRYRRRAAQFRGLEVSPAVHGIGFDDPRTRALVDVAAEEGHPVYTVCLGRPGTRAGDLAALARRYPMVPFVFGHCGSTGIDTAGLGEVAGQSNVYAETSGCLAVTVRVALARLGPHRVLFGTEYPLQEPGVELAKYAALGLAPAVWRDVAWGNALRLLGGVPS